MYATPCGMHQIRVQALGVCVCMCVCVCVCVCVLACQPVRRAILNRI